MPLHIVAENHNYYGKRATDVMVERNCWVGDLGRTMPSRDRMEVPHQGAALMVIRSGYLRTKAVEAGDTLRMVRRGPRGSRVVWEAIATGRAEYRLADTLGADDSFYSQPAVVGARRRRNGMPIPGGNALGYGGLQDGRAFQVFIPVDSWRPTTLPPAGYTPHATILTV